MSGDTSAPATALELVGQHRVELRRDDAVDTLELIGRDGQLVLAIEVRESGPVLRFEGAGQPGPYPLNRFAPDGFAVWGFEAVFTRGSDGKVDGFIMNTPPASGMRYVKRAPG